MPTTYNLAPIPRWQFTQGNSTFDVYGKLHTYRADAKSEPKTCYQDAAGTIPYPNPIILDGVGSVGPIYWASDENYYLELRDPTDTQVIWTVEDFNAPNSGGGPGPTVEIDYRNYIPNGQFDLIPSNVFPEVSIPISGTSFVSSYYWNFSRSNTSPTDSMTLKKFILGQTDVEGDPKYYMRHACTVVGSTSAKEYIIGPISKVNSFANKQITCFFWAKSDDLINVNLKARQVFGTGGSATVDTLFWPTGVTLTTGWVKYSATITVPNINGKTIGSESEDYFYIVLSLPVDRTFLVDFTTFQLNLGNKILDYEIKTMIQNLSERGGYDTSLVIPTKNINDIVDPNNTWFKNNSSITYNYDYATSVASYIPAYPMPIGGIIMWPLDDNIPDYFQVCAGFSMSQSFYKNLYAKLLRKYGAGGGAVPFDLGANYVSVRGDENGAVTAPSDHNTGFTFTTITAGDATHKQEEKITVGAASTFQNGAYFYYYTYFNVPYFPTKIIKWKCIAVKNGIVNFTSEPNTENALFFVNDGYTAAQVATSVNAMFNPLSFKMPDYSGAFIRAVDFGRGRDPNAATRNAREDGVVGDHAGTWQPWQVQNHVHTNVANTLGNNLVQGGTADALLSGNTGGVVGGALQTNPINFSALYIMRVW